MNIILTHADMHKNHPNVFLKPFACELPAKKDSRADFPFK